MKLKKFSLALMTIAGLSSTIAHAACGTDRCSNMKITQIMPIANGDVFIGLNGDITSLNCTPVGGNRLTLASADEGSDKIYSFLLTKYIANESVQIFRIRTGSSGCEIYYVSDEK